MIELLYGLFFIVAVVVISIVAAALDGAWEDFCNRSKKDD